MGIAGQAPPGPGGQDAAGLLGQLLVPSSPPPLPTAASHRSVREAVATVLERVSANELAEECVRFGLEPSSGGADDPWHGKWRYVERRLRHLDLADLLALARKVTEIYEDPVLDHLLGLAGARGVRGEMKNLIFAANGPKPKIILRDAVNNDLEIVENAEHCLVYDRPLAQAGLTGRQFSHQSVLSLNGQCGGRRARPAEDHQGGTLALTQGEGGPATSIASAPVAMPGRCRRHRPRR